MQTLLITRPKSSAERLANYLQILNYQSIIFPVLDIQPPTQSAVLVAVITQEQEYDDFIFVSPTAVEQFVVLTSGFMPTHPRIIAMGEGTAQALLEAKIHVDLFPPTANSAALLAMPAMQTVQQRKIAIFTGESGNRLLQEILSARGADVTMAYTHRRQLPEYDAPLTWQPEAVDVSVVTSTESLENFSKLIEQHALQTLYEKALLVITPAMVQQAKKIGFKAAIILAENAYNESIARVLKSIEEKK